MILWKKDHRGAVLFDDRPLLGGHSRGEFLAQLRERLRGRVKRAYTFGSFNTAAFRAGSDIDLILVCDAQDPFYERAARFADLHELYTPLDILVYCEEELESLLQEKAGFWKSVAATMREI